jgi:hypothetical protein
VPHRNLSFDIFMVNKPRRLFWIRNSTDKEMLAKYCMGHLLRSRDMDERKEVVPTALYGS